jgi:hypothetical protein
MIFIDICKKTSSPVICANHVHFIQSSVSLEIDKIYVPHCKVEKDLENPDGLEELRKLDIKETKGSGEI